MPMARTSMVAATEINPGGRPKDIDEDRVKKNTNEGAKFEFDCYWRTEILRTRLRSMSWVVPFFILMCKIPFSGTVICSPSRFPRPRPLSLLLSLLSLLLLLLFPPPRIEVLKEFAPLRRTRNVPPPTGPFVVCRITV
jgi:hypothetical protein